MKKPNPCLSQINFINLDNYFKSLETLKNNLNKYGYKNQIELKNDDKKNDEIGVVIDRHGEIIKLEDKFGGTHRFALCKILGISKIIVSIKAIHKSLIKEELIDKITTQNEIKKIIFVYFFHTFSLCLPNRNNKNR